LVKNPQPVGPAVGRTWPDVVASIPFWLIGAAAACFVALLIYSVTFASHQFHLGFLGDFGPAGSAGTAEIPTGAVVAFNRSESTSIETDSGACPNGWSIFREAGGRAIIGAGQHPNPHVSTFPSFMDNPMAAVGGAEEITLLPNNLPPHIHHGTTDSVSGTWDLVRTDCCSPGAKGTFAVAPVPRTDIQNSKTTAIGHIHTIVTDGGVGLVSAPFSIRSPFIALYYCRKD
jgi:hypothetical protein